ncbi:aconitase X catalytic domain-containing protein [Arthrobacter sp. NPDC089319]|uniref:aconitase X catalytic domain-containing protein n=1 Tax=Arthrobacter sp. NPDC089319 TaxID=3155915 RepID=UPI003413CCBC
MKLTEIEKAMRDGREGEAVAAAMDLLIRYGVALGADRLVQTRNVAGTMTQPSPVRTRLVEEGGWAKSFAVTNLDCDRVIEIPRMKVPTCQVQHGMARDALGLSKYREETIELQEGAESYFTERGIRVLATCTPYQVGNRPAFGEHCAWMESSAVVYCNSVLGARTNCEGTASAGAAALTGRIPYWGNHLDENRLGNRWISVETEVDSFLEWGLLGYFVGEMVGEQRPVITGRVHKPSDADLKHFGAAAATGGGVEIFHIPGLTPEAPTFEAAFGQQAPRSPDFTYTKAERNRIYQLLNNQGQQRDVDFILLGCPHASIEQLEVVGSLLAGKRVHADARVWIMVPRDLRRIADERGLTQQIRGAGASILTDSCPAMSRVAPEGTKVFATDSVKQANYLPGMLGIEGWLGTTEDCINAAITGKWKAGASV